jgi:hypothetical protein
MAVVVLKLPRGTYGLVGIAGWYFRENIYQNISNIWLGDAMIL